MYDIGCLQLRALECVTMKIKVIHSVNNLTSLGEAC